MERNYSENIESLTRKLVSIKSITGKENSETKIANYIKDYFLKLSYFKNNPQQVMTFDCGNKRYSTLSYIKGKGKDTLILMGHIDTVDILDYGKIQNKAFNPDELIKALNKEFDLNKEVKKDIASNDYLFSRGILDMKAGVAAYMEIMKYFSNHLDELNGNLVFLAECDEEGDSKGIIKALDILNELKIKEDFNYLGLINGDYDVVRNNERYIYLGTIGKLLPCFVAIGKESHVGNPFNGFDPNLLLSIINKNISLNMELADHIKNQTTFPPISLKQADNKNDYTVQTATSAFSYFNYLIYNSSPKTVLNKCLKIAKDSFKETISLLNNNYHQYCLMNKKKYQKLPYEVNVYTYEKWDELLSKDPDYKRKINNYKKKLLKDNPTIDMREFSYKVILYSYNFYKEKKPVLILFYGSMFYSPIETKDQRIINAVNKAIKKVQVNSKYQIKTAYYYPYISDMSFLATPFKINDIKAYTNNMVFDINYPYEAIKNIDIPVINIGTYGKDGHTFVERLEKDYSFKKMPILVYETIKAFFNNGN